jgi:MYXO-CTERM domain-containing protein
MSGTEYVRVATTSTATPAVFHRNPTVASVRFASQSSSLTAGTRIGAQAGNGQLASTGLDGGALLPWGLALIALGGLFLLRRRPVLA